MIQEVGLFPHFTVERNVGLVPTLDGWPALTWPRRVEQLLTRWDCRPEEFRGALPAPAFRRPTAARRRSPRLGSRPSPVIVRRALRCPRSRNACRTAASVLRLATQPPEDFDFRHTRCARGTAPGNAIGLLTRGRLEVAADPQEFRNARTEEALAFLGSLD